MNLCFAFKILIVILFFMIQKTIYYKKTISYNGKVNLIGTINNESIIFHDNIYINFIDN